MFLSSLLQVGILQTHWEAARHNLKVSQKDAGVSETNSSMLKIMNPSEAVAVGGKTEMPPGNIAVQDSSTNRSL